MKKSQNIITSDDILGKDVIDTDGEVIGVSTKIHIDNKNKQIVGLTIDQGFMKPDLYIGLGYVRTFGVDTIMLSTSPKSKIRGLKVLDNSGEKIGWVIDVMSVGKTNKIKGVKIKQKTFSKPFMIQSKDIEEVGYSIILRKGWSKIEDLK
jgi:sporulation protein YlmC with PRC-barrel domain